MKNSAIGHIKYIYSRDAASKEDTSVEGGISLKAAERISQELTKAVEYVKSLKRER